MIVGWTARCVPEVPERDDWFGEAELALLARLVFPRRRNAWRLGRWAAKNAAAGLLKLRPDPDSLRRIEILAAPDGAPETRVDGRPAPISLSLSHRDPWGFAAVAPPGCALGCDVEGVEIREWSFAEDYFTSAENAILKPAAPAERALFETLIWSAKESALKALRVGLLRDTRSVEVSVPFPAAEAPWNHLAVQCLDSARVFRGMWRVEAGFVFTMVSDPPADGAAHL